MGEGVFGDLKRCFNLYLSFLRAMAASLFCPAKHELERLDGKTVVITGSNSGIGLEMARAIYVKGGRVVLACRNLDKAREVVQRIENQFQSKNSGQLIVKQLDLSSFESVRKCASEILRTERHVHVLINNAGVMHSKKVISEVGIESTFATNHLGHFLFTLLLCPKLVESSPARIINVTSVYFKAKARINWTDLNYNSRKFQMFKPYGESKLGNVLFTAEIARKLKGTGVTAYSVDPGLVATSIFERVKLPRIIESTKWIMAAMVKSPAQGAAPILYCVDADIEQYSGYYFHENRPEQNFESQQMVDQAHEMWEKSCRLVNVEDQDKLKRIL